MHQTVRDSSSAHSEASVYASRLEDESDHESTSAPLAKMKTDVQLARTPTKRTEMHFDGASNTAGTDDEERRAMMAKMQTITTPPASRADFGP